jgi:type VI secretion system protein VasD
MNIDLISRAAINPNGQGQSLSTVIRLYQLKNADTFEKLDYAQLQSDDLANLQQDLLAQKNIVLRPDASASISEPMEKGTRYVGVVAFFLNPDADGHWKLAIPIAQWKKTDPVKIEVRGNTLQIQKV